MSVYSAKRFVVRVAVRDSIPESVRARAQEVADQHLDMGGSAAGAVNAAKVYARLHSVCHFGHTTPPEAA